MVIWFETKCVRHRSHVDGLIAVARGLFPPADRLGGWNVGNDVGDLSRCRSPFCILSFFFSPVHGILIRNFILAFFYLVLLLHGDYRPLQRINSNYR